MACARSAAATRARSPSAARRCAAQRASPFSAQVLAWDRRARCGSLGWRDRLANTSSMFAPILLRRRASSIAHVGPESDHHATRCGATRACISSSAMGHQPRAAIGSITVLTTLSAELQVATQSPLAKRASSGTREPLNHMTPVARAYTCRSPVESSGPTSSVQRQPRRHRSLGRFITLGAARVCWTACFQFQHR